MVKILFLCHGNICRSPMGEFVLKDMVKKAGMADRFEIASAAVSREEIGNPVYPPARRELARHGISCTGHTARQITRRDLDYYDGIYYMDASNARYLRRLFGDDAAKCKPLLSRDVADPWYTGDFSQTWEDVCEGCRKIMEEYGC
ncbi:MAG: low molecular weight phosphotyrosine protein phosphatase [Oscillospiraceae bacterium]|nr:low molecular weight phosphotyrosine protein phosphatase [Oscillospiraceae bacterium]